MLLRAIIESIARSIIRFFDSRNEERIPEEVLYLRMELEKRDQMIQSLMDRITNPVKIEEPKDDHIIREPIKGYEPPNQKRSRLENESYRKYLEMQKAAILERMQPKTTEEMEAEIGIQKES